MPQTIQSSYVCTGQYFCIPKGNDCLYTKLSMLTSYNNTSIISIQYMYLFLCPLIFHWSPSLFSLLFPLSPAYIPLSPELRWSPCNKSLWLQDGCMVKGFHWLGGQWWSMHMAEWFRHRAWSISLFCKLLLTTQLISLEERDSLYLEEEEEEEEANSLVEQKLNQVCKQSDCCLEYEVWHFPQGDQTIQEWLTISR